jgi:hypothetical protein
MSTTQGEEVKFKCLCECRPYHCPGHVVRVDYHNTSDVVNVYLDGELAFCLDPEQWIAMKKSAERWTA